MHATVYALMSSIPYIVLTALDAVAVDILLV